MLRCLLGALVLVVLTGCNPFHRIPRISEPISLLAVMPMESVERVSATPAEGVESLPPDAARKVTAEVYGVLTSSSDWRVVPDLTAMQALSRIKPGGDLASRARALGQEVGADGALFGTVSRYVERVGTGYGARQPAAVAITLQLISVKSGKILWSGSFDETQRPLSSNLFNWWQFWRGGPRWFTAQEFARLGVEHLLRDLSKRTE
ncbi:MAG: hypothetical protein ACHQ9S_10410 [Candidatus Binatia bacterium]